ncbi:hypothetical protein [Methanocalculus taiwanensis]|nr:hypothetical protein [Methanocalculus taiwanensis]
MPAEADDLGPSTYEEDGSRFRWSLALGAVVLLLVIYAWRGK